ncbi:IS630 family transposase [Acaryochloris marina]|uniref:IS630 family transposase n=1 Tax=Acaryochloris marina TaxID=155978 RepID=UPI001BAF628A|nr:IS630 family transposase [Acaryochloris marina]QUY43148.1 IS630 family transposase [Acaryochloris marina S15]
MPKIYSYDLRCKVIDAIELDGMPPSEASDTFHISRNTINLWQRLKAETGDLHPIPRQHLGHSHKITDWDKFRAFAQEHRYKTQAQMAELWEGQISERTISRALKNIGFTRKKTYGYRQRDEHKRAEFVQKLTTVDPDDIVYADESGMDNRDEYDYGYGPKGERVYALKSGSRSGRVNMIAALRGKQLMAPFTIEGACNRTVFEIWLETCLIPMLKPGQKLVIDNATFHKEGRIEQLVEAAGCEVWYLPPYSPDLNKIERSWAWIKSRIRHQLEHFSSLREAMEHVLNLAS